ncbi:MULTISPECIES: DUF4328 domain-containing protein [Mycolicibacterium]|uniref:DUF4328 domain-containing protein n=1 Tax=Mycolicibacterium TaxID=1866885 RepID=UPI0005600EBF|nr:MULTISPECIES: DUF4328 domain-containing protein [Mycolicibacterium]PQP49624.1 DUF4328 domain-containing protein [Mycolicibacterium austroafricanum]QZT56817.1 DUF4328 domain-containing protein [Mycolicibacterium austroafricanum]QZY45916.1 DUF4328 domain-containing protein [Mycolicibacterium austroafricanum]UJL30380.1 DUF4328 domain-containing protein [Mycolicibacterium vanbaalenii]WND56527.1 DUF4328 domain-containing protein [Mycolicibacterium vanbaalenii]
MIQVCSQCGTRWNVRDRQRVWCPRCRGTLLAPSGHAAGHGWDPRQASPQDARRQGARLPSGYRWVAVRPGAPPRPPRRRRDLGPTPRYLSIPRWGLVERFDVPVEDAAQRKGPSVNAVQMTLVATMAVLGAAAFVHVVRYVLLIVNRSVLLNPWIAGAATWGGVAVSVVAVFLTVASLVVLTNWLIARRSAAFAHQGHRDPRSAWVLRLGCLTPFVNLFWAPVYVMELADAEGRQRWLHRPIVVWWLFWVASTTVSTFAFATSFTADAQGIADNTVTTIVAYLFAAAALLSALRVFLGFERQPVQRPSRRWVTVRVDAGESDDAEPARAVESNGENPAA